MRKLLTVLFLVALALTLAGLTLGACSVPEPPPRPTVVLITLDTTRAENLSTFERKLNNVIGLKHALELVEPLLGTLDCAQAPLLQRMADDLR